MDIIPVRPLRPRLPRTPQRDHSELFIQRKNSSAQRRVVTPSKLVNQLQGLYHPENIHSQRQDLSNAVSRAMNESGESLDARMDARSVEIEIAFEKVVELLMWNDKPKKTTLVKRKAIRCRVATKLELPIFCFENGPWAQKSKDIIDAEVVSY